MSQKTPILALKRGKSDGCDGLKPKIDTLSIEIPYEESIKKSVTPVTPVTFPENREISPAIKQNIVGDITPVHRWRDVQPNVATPAATAPYSRDDDNRARALLAKYRREGGVIELEEIESGGATWLSLACDLSAMPAATREGRYLAIEQNARLFQRALELETR
jgi:hypothetical protein